MTVGGDDLDDGLDYEFNENDDLDQGELVEPELTDSSGEETKIKRPLEGAAERAIEKPSAISVKRKKGEKLTNKKRQKVDQDVQQKSKLALQDSSLIADFIASNIRRKQKDLTDMELQELYINQDKFKDTLNFQDTRNLDNYSRFLKQFFSKSLLNQKSKNRRYILILATSAIRACEIQRALSDLKSVSVKLIQKNTLAKDKDYLSRKDVKLAVSTPGRIQKLLANGE